MPIDAMKDIHLPDAPSYWPVPWTVWALILALLLVALLGYAIRRIMIKRKKNTPIKISHSFRQEALRELQRIRWEHDNPAQCLQEINIVLKRVAITRFKRIEVSALTGDVWLDYLNQGVERPLFSKPPTTALGTECFNPNLKMEKSAFKKVLSTAKQWIENQ